MTSGKIADLGRMISVKAQFFDEQLGRNGGEASLTNARGTSELPQALQKARYELLEALDELESFVEGPAEMLMRIGGIGSNIRPALHAIVRFRLADAVPITSTTSYAAIAKSSGLDESNVKRILRMAMTYRIFQQVSPDMVQHTEASRMLVESRMLSQWLENAIENVVLPGYYMVDAMERWPNSSEPNESGFNIQSGSTDSFFETLGRDPSKASKFAVAMGLFATSPLFSVDHLVNNFGWGHDWPESQSISCARTVVDIGGSKGDVSFEIARKHPNINCIIQDRGIVIKEAIVPPDLVDRVRFMEHDFFNPQPIESADVYLLRWILHDWSDLYAVKILRSLIPALKSRAKIVINDQCSPDMSDISLYRQRVPRSQDLYMKHIQNGRERDRNDWILLLETADKRFRLDQIIEPPGSALAIIVALWEG